MQLLFTHCDILDVTRTQKQNTKQNSDSVWVRLAALGSCQLHFDNFSWQCLLACWPFNLCFNKQQIIWKIPAHIDVTCSSLLLQLCSRPSILLTGRCSEISWTRQEPRGLVGNSVISNPGVPGSNSTAANSFFLCHFFFIVRTAKNFKVFHMNGDGLCTCVPMKSIKTSQQVFIGFKNLPAGFYRDLETSGESMCSNGRLARETSIKKLNTITLLSTTSDAASS